MHSTKLRKVNEPSLVENISVASHLSQPSVVRLGPDSGILKYFSDTIFQECGDTEVTAPQEGNSFFRGTLRDLVNHTRYGQNDATYMTQTTLRMLGDNVEANVPSALRRLNWLAALPDDLKPDWFWLMIGQAKTGSPRHVDTGASSAWNLLLWGQKAWKFGSPAIALSERRLPLKGEVFRDTSWKSFEHTQLPGELIFTPAGWVHEVINIEPSAALTGNFVNSTNIHAAIEFAQQQNDPDREQILRDVSAAFCGK